MIEKVEMLTNAQLEHIRQIVGEAFVTNELFQILMYQSKQRI